MEKDSGKDRWREICMQRCAESTGMTLGSDQYSSKLLLITKVVINRPILMGQVAREIIVTSYRKDCQAKRTSGGIASC